MSHLEKHIEPASYEAFDEVWEEPIQEHSDAFVEKEWSNFEGALFPERKKKSNRSLYIYLAGAAAVLIALLVVFYPTIQSEVNNNSATSSPQETWVQAETFTKGITNFTLEDGTKVILSDGSEISYPNNFTENRTVKLKGSAYFEVAKDANHPFKIQTAKYTTTVLGTHFYMENANDFEVSLFEGKVKILSENGKEETLQPGQAFVAKSGYSAQVRNTDVFSDSQVVDFQNEPLLKVIGFLQSTKGVSFNFSDQMANLPITIRIGKNDQIENIMKTLSNTTQLNYQMDGNQIMIK